ncbi:hypothetical protein Anapl_05898 [Anas platyrhynchos]|uniref:Uncharacterized protein n=1 Tax=Anas platyrhynchos TaxID=8839 RepID=R0JTG5_ANAPL|nr:hypothetical protein Anapl_05898 [Anas platyrhynchos]
MYLERCLYSGARAWVCGRAGVQQRKRPWQHAAIRAQTRLLLELSGDGSPMPREWEGALAPARLRVGADSQPLSQRATKRQQIALTHHAFKAKQLAFTYPVENTVAVESLTMLNSLDSTTPKANGAVTGLSVGSYSWAAPLARREGRRSTAGDRTEQCSPLFAPTGGVPEELAWHVKRQNHPQGFGWVEVLMSIAALSHLSPCTLPRLRTTGFPSPPKTKQRKPMFQQLIESRQARKNHQLIWEFEDAGITGKSSAF